MTIVDSLRGILRPQALEGWAYTRLGEPGDAKSPRLAVVLLLSSTVFLATIAALFFTPLRIASRSDGIVDLPPNTRVLRAPRSGVLESIVQEHTKFAAGQPLVRFVPPSPVATETPDKPYMALLEGLEEEHRSAQKHIQEKLDLESARRDRALATIAIQMRALTDEEAEARALAESLDSGLLRLTSAQGFVSKLDIYALRERLTAARSRLTQLTSRRAALTSELADAGAQWDLARISASQETARADREFKERAGQLSEKLRYNAYTLSADIEKGEVLATYKVRGDWVAEGEELLIYSGSTQPSTLPELLAPISDQDAPLAHEGTPVRIWLKTGSSVSPALSGTVKTVFQRTASGYRDSHEGAPAPVGSYTLRIALTPPSRDAETALASLRPGMRVAVEVTLGFIPIYRALLLNN